MAAVTPIEHAAEARDVATDGATSRESGFTLIAAILGFFVVTLDAVVVNVALPSIGRDLGGGISGLQWVVDAYTLAFAGLLLSGGGMSDRMGARRAFAVGVALFAVASAVCGLAPDLGVLVPARFVQGSAAALIMPACMALLSHTFPEGPARARAIALWAMGGVAASTSGPLLGGLLTLASWRLIFFVNVPVGAVALLLATQIAPTRRRRVPLDWAGQCTGVVAMGALTYGAIEAGAAGFAAPQVLAAFLVALAAGAGFLSIEARVAHPIMPLGLFRSRNVSVSVVVGFAFVVGYYGLPFVMSLYLQQARHLSALVTGLVFLPMALVGAVLTPLSARLSERVGAPRLIGAGLVTMSVGLAVLAVVAPAASIWALSLLMVPAGLAGPTVMPPITAVLLNDVPSHRSGTASGVFNTSRQVGGALGVAVFGALLASHGTFDSGLRASLLLAAAVALGAGATTRLLVGRRGVIPAPKATCTEEAAA